MCSESQPCKTCSRAKRSRAKQELSAIWASVFNLEAVRSRGGKAPPRFGGRALVGGVEGEGWSMCSSITLARRDTRAFGVQGFENEERALTLGKCSERALTLKHAASAQ